MNKTSAIMDDSRYLKSPLQTVALVLVLVLITILVFQAFQDDCILILFQLKGLLPQQLCIISVDMLDRELPSASLLGLLKGFF